jgi:hypothetical protein
MGSPTANRHGNGSFRRRIIIVTLDERTVAAGLEDEMHHFEVRVHHDGVRVLSVEGVARRFPWMPCADSPKALAAFEGLELTAQLSSIVRWTESRFQCTHQFDLVTLAVAHAARAITGGEQMRTYDVVVPDFWDPPFTATVSRDGAQLLTWQVGLEEIIGPDPFTGVPLRGRFLGWCEAHLDPELTEAAFVLRMGARLSWARRLDMDADPDAIRGGLIEGWCYTAQPERIHVAFRNRNSVRDYGNHPEAPLAGYVTVEPDGHLTTRN